MTLASVPRYDPGSIDARDDHGVVVGASMAGMLAARVLYDRFDEVTLIEKDPLRDEPVVRAGVPQANHVHVLQEAGRATLEDLFPGYGEELLAEGGLVLDLASDVHFFSEGDFIAHGPNRLPMYCASRPLFEFVTRRRVEALDGVSVRGNTHFVEYTSEDDGSITGVIVRDDGGEAEHPAQLVVDATGRTSRTPAWLEDSGYTPPATDEVRIDLAYSTAVVERPSDVRRATIALPSPPETRGGGVFPVEDERWVMTLAGFHGDHPPTEQAGFAEFAESLPVDEFRRILDTHRVISEDIEHYPFQSTIRRRYEELDRFPDGLLVVGDAIASFNPIYGQGMSVAALQALQLHHTLAGTGRDDLALRFFDRAGPVVDDAWSIAVGADFEYPQTTGPKPRGTDLLNKYLSRLTRKAHADGKLAEAFTRVVIMEERPTSLFRPGVMWRVLKPTR